MKTIRTLLAGFAGLTAITTAALAGPDTWRRPDTFKPAVPKSCCAGHSVQCAPRGTCCDVKHSYSPAAGHGTVRNTTVLCNTACAMPVNDRGCCRTGCVH